MEYGLGGFGDRRLQEVGAFLHRRLVEVGQRGVSVRGLGGDRAGEIRLTRFLRNPKVDPEGIVAHAADRTRSRATGLHVLAIQDTTSLRDDGRGHSLQLHPTIAVEAETGALLGLVHAELLERQGGQKGGGRKGTRRERAFEDKESRRWLRAAEAAAGLRDAGAACVTVLADRESDIYELLAYRPEGVELLVRAAQDRALEGGARLFSHLAAQEEAGRFAIELSAAPGRPARKARLAVRCCRAAIERPRARPGGRGLPAQVAVHLVELREIEVPEGATPVHWRLLTTHAVDGFEEARWIARLYARRWIIEQLFRTIKTRGFDVERVAIGEAPFFVLAVATLVAGVSVLQLVQGRDGAGGRPFLDVFEPDEQAALEAVSASLEGKTARQKNPHPEGSLAFAAWVCARLGGWTGYYGKPGPVVMLRGLYHFRAMQHGWNIAKDV